MVSSITSQHHILTFDGSLGLFHKDLPKGENALTLLKMNRLIKVPS